MKYIFLIFAIFIVSCGDNPVNNNQDPPVNNDTTAIYTIDSLVLIRGASNVFLSVVDSVNVSFDSCHISFTAESSENNNHTNMSVTVGNDSIFRTYTSTNGNLGHSFNLGAFGNIGKRYISIYLALSGTTGGYLKIRNFRLYKLN